MRDHLRRELGAGLTEGIRLVLAALMDPVVAADASDRIVFLNGAAERLLGWSAHELIGRPLTIMMPERFRAAHQAGFSRFMSTGRGRIMGRPVRVPALHRHGMEIDIELTLSKIEPAPGQIMVVATLRDLRERIELERRIVSQRKILAQHAAVGVLTESSSVEEAIPRLLEATASALHWHVGVYWTLGADHRLHLSAVWAARPAVAETFRAGCERLTFAPGEGLPGQALQLGRAVWSRDVRNDDRYVRARLAAEYGLRSALLFPVFSAGRTLGVLEYLSEHEEEPDEELIQTMGALGFQVGQFLDRLRGTEDLGGALERMRFLVEASTLLSSSLDLRATLAGFVRLAVPRLAEWASVKLLVGREGEPRLEEAASAHVDPARQPLLEELKRSSAGVAVSGPPGPIGLWRVPADGRPVFLPEVTDEMLVAEAGDPHRLELLRRLGLRSVIRVPLIHQGKTLGVMGLHLGDSGGRFNPDDLELANELARRLALAVEHARLYDQATKAIAVRDQFLSIASHELKTPLTSLGLQIASLGRLLETGRLETLPREKLQGRVAIMESQSNRLAELIDELLDVSRISRGRVELHLERTPLEALAREVATRLADDAARSGNTITVSGDPSVAGFWDRGRLDQVITNLVGNALKYAPGKPVDITVERVDGQAFLRVRDQGPGIAEADQQRIFDQFERAASPNLGGLGLGLWLVRKIVEAHHGKVSIDSQPGQGATFTVCLPLDPLR